MPQILDLRDITDLWIGGVRVDVLQLGGVPVWSRPVPPSASMPFPVALLSVFGAAWDPYGPAWEALTATGDAPAVGDPVGRIPPIAANRADYSGTNRDLVLVAPATAARPVLREVAGRRAWEFDGTDDMLETIWAEELEPGKTVTWFAMVYGQADRAGWAMTVARGENANSWIGPFRGATGAFGTTFRHGSSEFGVEAYGALEPAGWHAVIVEYAITAWGSGGGRLKVELDGVEVVNTPVTPSKSATASITTMTRLLLGARRSGGTYDSWHKGHLGRCGVVSKALSAAERGLLRSWMQATAAGASSEISWPAQVAAGLWTVTEVTSAAEASTAGFAGEDGHLKAVFGAITVPAGFELRHSLRGGASETFNASYPNVAPSATYYTQTPLEVGASAVPRLYWVHVATGQAQLAGSKAAMTIAGLATAGGSSLPALAAATLSRVRGYGLYRHGADATADNPAMGWHCCSLAMLGYSAFRGDTDSDARVLQQIRNLITASNSPASAGGFAQQFEVGPLALFVLARLTPRIWGALTAAERSRVDVLVRAIGFSGAFVASDDYPWPTSRGYTVCGNQAWRNGNPNFAASDRAAVSLLAIYAGSTATVNGWLHGFEKADLRAELTSLGLSKPATVWAARPSGTPNDAQIQSVIRAGGSYTVDGFSLGNLQGIWVEMMTDKAYNRQVKSGLGGTSGNSWIGPGVEAPSGQMRGKVMGSPTPPSWWTAIRGQPGMVMEMDSSDAEGLRSAVGYAVQTHWLMMAWTLVMIASGRLDRTNADVQAALVRMRRGALHFRWVNAVGYLSYSHGGVASNNEDWTASAYAAQRGLDTLDEVSDVIEAWRAA